MAGQFFRGNSSTPPPLSDISPALFRYQRFWQKVIVYRPILILAGIWIVLLASALVAYERLLYAEKDPSQTKTDTPETTIAVYPHQRIDGDRPQEASVADNPESSQSEQADVGGQPDTPGTTATNTAAAEVIATSTELPQNSIFGVSPWALAVLVVTCAGGCSLLSRQLQRSRRPRRKAKKRVLPQRQFVPLQNAQRQPVRQGGVSFAPKRLATYTPNQPIVPPLRQGKNDAAFSARFSKHKGAKDEPGRCHIGSGKYSKSFRLASR